MNEAREATFVADGVHDTGHPFTVSVDSPEGWSGEIGRAFGAGDGKAMLDVTANLVELQRFQVIANGDALAEVLEMRTIEVFPKLGLAHEDDLQELAFVSFEIGEKPDLFEEVVGHVLRFVDDENGVLVLVDEAEEEFVEEGGGFEAVEVEAADIEAEFHGDGFDEAIAVEHGVEDEGGFPLGPELFEHGAADGGLASANFAGELNESLALPDAVKQVIVGFAMLRTEEQEPWIRSNIKWWLVQAIIL